MEEHSRGKRLELNFQIMKGAVFSICGCKMIVSDISDRNVIVSLDLGGKQFK